MSGELHSNSIVSSAGQYGEEIDLIELMAILWSGKWLIIATTTIITIIGFFALKAIVPTYRVQATINPPTVYQIKNIQPSKLSSGGEYQVETINLDELYVTAATYLNSIVVQKMYWESFSGEQLNMYDSSQSPNELEFKKFAGGLRIENLKLDDSGISVSEMMMEVANPEKGVEQLNQFISFVDRYVVNELLNQIRTAYTTNLTRLKADFEAVKRFEKRKMEDELTRLVEAHEIANSLGILETPYDEIENIELKILDNRLYLLGAKVLSEEMKSLEFRLEGPLVAYVPRLREMERWMEQIESDLERLNVESSESHAFKVAMPPQSSVNPVGVNKILILLVITAAGGLIGVFLVLVLFGIKVYNIRQQSE